MSTVATGQPASGRAAPAAPLDPVAMLRSKRYIGLLLLAGAIGAPISAVAYWFLVLVTDLQRWVYQDLPSGLSFQSEPTWWPLPVLAVGGLLVALTIRYFPGHGGESPADGFQAGHITTPISVPGVAVAAILTLGSGAVLGPEAPLIALGAGLAATVVSLRRRATPPQAVAIVASAGSFAAISTLLGSPLIAAFLLMEAAGLGGPMLGLVLLPGLLAAGIGSLIFIGLDSWTGHGTFSLSIPNLPTFTRPDIAQFGWALAIGVAAALVATAIHYLALLVRTHVVRRSLLLTPAVGLLIAGLAILYGEVSGKAQSDVLFSGQDELGPLISNSAGYTVGALLLLVACKSLAYTVSLGSLRGGPIFPAIYVGAAGGIAMSHLPGLPLVPAMAMGIGAMSVSMLRLPLTSVMLATLLLLSDGLAVMPLVIVSVVVAHVVRATLPAGPHGAAVPVPHGAAAPVPASSTPGDALSARSG